jgi:hypothetical protein
VATSGNLGSSFDSSVPWLVFRLSTMSVIMKVRHGRQIDALFHLLPAISGAILAAARWDGHSWRHIVPHQFNTPIQHYPRLLAGPTRRTT